MGVSWYRSFRFFPKFQWIIKIAIFCILVIKCAYGQEGWEPSDEEWGRVAQWANTHPEKASPPPFEKIYVGPNDLMTTPQGCYYMNAWGEKEKVCAVLNDYRGCYVIKITRQCPVCGRCCNDYKSSEGYDCPFGKVEVLPHIWSDP